MGQGDFSTFLRQGTEGRETLGTRLGAVIANLLADDCAYVGACMQVYVVFMANEPSHSWGKTVLSGRRKN